MNKDMSASDQLKAAARLVNKALLQLDVQQETCTGCGRISFLNYGEAKIYEKFCNLPDTLTLAADDLAKGGK